MKKFIYAFVASCLFLSATALPTHAQDTSQIKTNGALDELLSTYDSSSVDWESIDSIFVSYLDGDLEKDPFLKDAKDRGILIVLEPSVYMQTRSFAHFNSISWVTRSDGITLSVMPKDPFAVSKEAAWQEIYRFIQYHPLYTQVSNSTKNSSMYNQFVCHADFARGFKTPWNIEPWRPDKGYWWFVNGGCN